MDEQKQPAGDGQDAGAWEELAGRLETVMDAEQSGAPAGLTGAGGEISPQGLPVLDRLAQATEQLELILSSQSGAADNPMAGPMRAPRPEDIMPGPTAFGGYPAPHAAWHGGAPWGIDASALPTPEAPFAESLPSASSPAPEFPLPPVAHARADFPDLTSLAGPGGGAPEAAQGRFFAGERMPARDSEFPLPPTAPANDDFPDLSSPSAPFGESSFPWAAAGAPLGDENAFPEMPAAPHLGGEFPELPEPPAFEYPHIPMLESVAPEARHTGDQGPEREGGVLGDLAETVRQLKDAVAGLQAGHQGTSPFSPSPSRMPAWPPISALGAGGSPWES